MNEFKVRKTEYNNGEFQIHVVKRRKCAKPVRGHRASNMWEIQNGRTFKTVEDAKVFIDKLIGQEVKEVTYHE